VLTLSLRHRLRPVAIAATTATVITPTSAHAARDITRWSGGPAAIT